MDCPARQLCNYFTSSIPVTTDFCGTIPRATIKTTNLMQWYGAIRIVKVFLLSEREISPNYTDIFLDFVHGFGSYVKGLPKTKRCHSVAVTVSVRFRFGFGVYVKQPLLHWIYSFHHEWIPKTDKPNFLSSKQSLLLSFVKQTVCSKNSQNLLTLCTTSVVCLKICKLFGSRSGPTICRAWSGSKLLDTRIWYSWIFFFEKVDQQTTKKNGKLPSRQFASRIIRIC